MPTAVQVARHTAARRRRYGRRGWFGFASEPLPVTFPSSQLATTVRIALGADLSASRYTWNWLDITEHVRHDLGITLEVGRRNESSRVTASKAQLKLANPAGIFSRRNPMGPYYGLLGGKNANVPIWIELDPGDGYRTMFEGYINDLPTRWTDPSGTDSYVVIQCAGIMRRLEVGENLKSPMFRSISGVAANDYVPHAYLPMEDEAGSTQFASGLPSGPPATISGSVNFASDAELEGSLPLPSLDAGSVVSATFPVYTNTDQWVVQLAVKVDSEPAADTTILEVDSPGGSSVRWRLYIQPGAPTNLWWAGYNSTGVITTSSPSVTLSGIPGVSPTEAEFYGTWWFYTLSSRLAAPGEVWGTFSLTDDGAIASTSFAPESPATHAAATAMRLYGSAGVTVGHWALFTNPAFDVTADAFLNAAAMHGHDGEMAHVRMARLCREEGIPFACQAATSAALGPQTDGTLLEALRACEKADSGVLYESGYGLRYQALSERYNQPVAFELDFDSRHIYGTPEPADNDQRFRNQWTIRREGGSSATARDPGYAATDGLYDDGDTINAATDDQLADHAAWRVHRDTIDEDRWPRLPINLGGTPDLIPGWLATPFGARITVANPPPEMTPDTIDAVLEGYTQRWDTVSWVASLNTSPATPYQVAVIEGTDEHTSPPWRLESGASSLAADVDTTAVSWSIATASGPLLSTSAADYPCDVSIGGERVTFTAVSGGSSPQTATVTRSVNNVVKSHAAGAAVRGWRLPGISI